MRIDRKQEIKKALIEDKELKRDGQHILFWLAVLGLLTSLVMQYFFVILSFVLLELGLAALYVTYVLYKYNFTIEVAKDGLVCYNWFGIRRRYGYEDLYLSKMEKGYEIKKVKKKIELFIIKNGEEYILFKSWMIECGIELEVLKV